MGVNDGDVRPGRRTTSSPTPRAPRTASRPMAKVLHRRVRHRQGPDDHDPRLHATTRTSSTARTRTCAAPAPPPSTSSRPRPVPPRRSAWCCPSSRASSTATRCASRSRPARPPTSPSTLGRETTGDEVNAAVQGAAEGPLKGFLRVHRGPDRLHRHRHRPGVVHLRRRPDQGHRQPGQGRRLVRQRVGLLQPPRRPGRARRRLALSAGRRMQTLDDLGDAARQAGPRPLRPQRARSTARRITDDGRIRASVPTIQPARRRGRARRRRAPTSAARRARRRPRYSLRPVADAARRAARPRRSRFATDTVGPSRAHGGRRRRSADGDVALLENVRFNPGETSKDDAERGAFADELAGARRRCSSATASASCTASRPASTTSPQRLPHAAGGLVLGRGRGAAPAHRATRSGPYVVVLGGSKVSDKLGVIDNLLGTADRLLIGGGMVFTFLAAQGHEVGTSLLEADQIDTVRGLPRRRARRARRRDRAADRHRRRRRLLRRRRRTRSSPADAIPADRLGLDIGPESARAVRRPARRRPDGLLERPDGRRSRWRRSPTGTRAVAQALTEVDGPHRRRRRRLGRRRARSSASPTAPSATSRPAAARRLEYLEGKTLPGLAVLED